MRSTVRGRRGDSRVADKVTDDSPPRAVTVRTAGWVSVALGLGGVSLAVAAAPVRPLIAQKQLVSHTDCQSAAQAAARPDFLAKSAEFRDDVHITTRYCSATAHNQLYPAKPQIVVVGADPDGSRENKIFMKTIPINDANKVHETCLRAGKAALPYSPTASGGASQTESAITSVEVQTGAGKVDCDDFLRATAADSPLVVLAPGELSGIAISVPILNMIGHKRPEAEVQAEMDSLAHRAASSVAANAEETRKHPQIILQASGPELRPAAH